MKPYNGAVRDQMQAANAVLPGRMKVKLHIGKELQKSRLLQFI